MIIICIIITILLLFGFSGVDIFQMDLVQKFLGAIICGCLSFFISAFIFMVYNGACVSEKYMICEKMVSQVEHISASMAYEKFSITDENNSKIVSPFEDIIFTKDAALTNSLMRVVSLIRVPQPNWLLAGWCSSSVKKTTIYYGAPFFVIKDDLLIKYE